MDCLAQEVGDNRFQEELVILTCRPIRYFFFGSDSPSLWFVVWGGSFQGHLQNFATYSAVDGLNHVADFLGSVLTRSPPGLRR